MDKMSAMVTFVKVVETGSFSAAARLLNISQPAISKSVAQLESWLGVRLLVRTTRGLSPTEAGCAFFERAKNSIHEAEEAEMAARGSGASLSGRLRVSAPVTFARLNILPRVPAFMAQHPNLSLDLVLDDRRVDLVEEGIDVSIQLGELPDSSLVARKIAEGHYNVLATPDYFARHGEPMHPDDLANHETVIYAQRIGGDVWSFRREAEELPVTVKGRLRVSAAEGVRAAVLAGAGLAIVPGWMFGPELISGAVTSALHGWTLPPMNAWAVYPSLRLTSSKAKAFISFVERELARTLSAISRPNDPPDPD